MIGNKLDIYVEQGRDYEISFVIKDQNGDPIDISGWTFKGQTFRHLQDDETKDLIINIVNAETGSIILTIPKDIIEQMDTNFDPWIYEFIFTDDNLKVRSVLSGKINITERRVRA